MANKQINAILSLTDKFSTPLFKVSANAGKATKQMNAQVHGLNKMASKVEKRMDKLVKSAFKWGKRLAIAGAGISLKVGWDGIKELDAGARKVKSIAKDALELGEIKDGLLELSGKTGVSVEDLAEAQYMAISSSVDPKESLAYAELASKMGKAGFADPREAIDLVTSMQNAYGEKGLGNAIKMADQFLHTQNKGKIEIGQMTQYYGKLIPLFSQAGVGYDEMNAAMATLTKMGMKPAEASTALAGAMRTMMKGPTSDKQAAAMEKLGVSFSAAELKAKGFGGMMEMVMKSAGGDMDKLSQIFPNARALLAGATMTGTEGMTEYKQILKELQTDTAGALDEAYETIQGSIGNQWDILKQNMKNVNTKFYMNYEGNLAEKLRELNEWFQNNPEKIDEAIQKLSDGIGKMIDKFIEFIDFVKRNKDTLELILVFFTSLYTSLKLIKGLAKVKGTLEGIKGALKVASLGKLGLAILGIALAITAVYKIYKKIKDVRENMPKLQEAGDDVPQLSIDGLDPYTPELTESEERWIRISDSLETIADGIEDLMEKLEKLKVAFNSDDWKENKWLNLLMALPTPLRRISGAVFAWRENIDTVKEGFGLFFEGVLELFGGILTLDWEMAWGGFKTALRGIKKLVEGIWGGVVDFVTAPISASIRLLDNRFPEKADKIREKWEMLIDLLKHPISGTVNLFSGVTDRGPGPVRSQDAGGAGKRTRDRQARGAAKVDSGVYSRYTGDMSWKGGIVQVHEKGGEILDLPGGTRIFPHDRSVRMAYEEGKNQSGGSSGGSPIVVNFNGDLYGDDEHLVDRIGSGIAQRIIKEMANI